MRKRKRRENQPPTGTVADVRGGPVPAKEGTLCLVCVRGLALRRLVVAALYPDVLHGPAAGARRGSAGAERTGEQVLYVLQLQALGLWEAAQDEEEA